MLLAEWTPTEIATLTAAISTPIAAFLTWLSTKGVDAYLKVKADARKDVEAEDKHMEDANTRLIAKLESQVESILTELKEVRSEHIECVKNYAEIKGQMTAMGTELSHLRSLVQPVTPSSGTPSPEPRQV